MNIRLHDQKYNLDDNLVKKIIEYKGVKIAIHTALKIESEYNKIIKVEEWKRHGYTACEYSTGLLITSCQTIKETIEEVKETLDNKGIDFVNKCISMAIATNGKYN